MKRFVIASEKSWNSSLVDRLREMIVAEWTLIASRKDLTIEAMERIDPDIIFFPHWSVIIPESIYERWECIVFHMTDLPYGRGGSPLQNLIVRGHRTTKISALRVTNGLDTGDIYLKEDLSLSGTAQDILVRANSVIQAMIIRIINEQPPPVPQSGVPVVFTRRRPEDGNLEFCADDGAVYDHIRMLDAEGYPPAFIDAGRLHIEFTHAVPDEKGGIHADAYITFRNAGDGTKSPLHDDTRVKQ